MSLSTSEVAAVVGELQPLAGAIAQKAYCPERRAALIELRKPHATHRLFVCAEPDRTRVHLVSKRPPSPNPPYAFQGLLRKEIVGRRLKSLHMAPDDRVVFLEFDGRGAVRTLVAELTGRHGNLFLLNGDGVILGLASENLSAVRDLFPGQPYLPPRRPAMRHSALVRFEALRGPFGLSRAIETTYADRDATALDEEKRRLLLAPAKRRRAQLERTIAKVTAETGRGAGAEMHRRLGELLIRNLQKIRRGAASVRLVEYAADGSREVEIALDPALSAKRNAERHFRLYRRLTRGVERAQERLTLLEGMRAQLDREITRVQSATSRELNRLASAAPRPRKPASKKPAEAPGKPYREYRSEDGTRLWVGRSAADNDALTFRHARGNDVWLHARNVTGAHVVVKIGEEDPPEETFLDAATLAAHFSDASGEPIVEVAWTYAKHIRKPKGAPAGSVSVNEEKTLRVRMERGRVDRLLASRSKPSPR
jgi:predicted ribosome quality control (RQC) complex YloA/Tae2 family protein